MDCLQAAIPPIAFCLSYDKPIDEARFRLALERSLCNFPCLAGRICRTTNTKEAPFQVKIHPSKGGAHFSVKKVVTPYKSKDDGRWFPAFTGPPCPVPHEPILTYGPLLKIKLTTITSTNGCAISFGFCHAVVDATSVGCFLETLSAHYVSDSPSNLPAMSIARAFPKVETPSEPLERFTGKKLTQSVPKLVKASIMTKTINLTIKKSELKRLKSEFLECLEGGLEWVSTYEMLGVLLLRAFYMASRKRFDVDGGAATTKKGSYAPILECRCIVDPRKRNSNPHVNETHQGNVSEMPSILLPFDSLCDEEFWQKKCLQDFHSQLRSSLEDSEKMTSILRRAQASLEKGHLHTQGGRNLSSLVFARNIVEDNVTSYNSWLHIDWFGIGQFGDAIPQHFQVSSAMTCVDMIWVFPKTAHEVTIRTTLPPKKAKRFLKVLTDMNVDYQVQ